MRRGFYPMLALLLIAASMSLAVSSASATGSGYSLSWVAGRPDVVSGTPVSANRIGASNPVMDSSGGMYLSDALHGYVYHLSASGVLAIIAGNGQTNGSGTPVAGPATSVEVHPRTIAIDGTGTVYIADARGYVFAVSPSGLLSIVAGGGAGSGPVPGPATASPVDPRSLAVDAAGDLYIGTPLYVLKVTTDGTLSIVAGDGETTAYSPPVPGPALSSPVAANGLTLDSAGNVFVADPRGWLLKVTPDGTLSVFSGKGTTPDDHPVPGPASQSPMEPTALAFDPSGNLYVGDLTGSIDKIATDGTLSIFAGTGKPTKPQPGPAASSPMFPQALSFDAAGILYFSDVGSLWKISAGTLSLVVANNVNGGPTPGPAKSSPMSPAGVAADSVGNIYVADPSGYIYKVTPSGVLSFFAGNGTHGGPIPGPATDSPVAPRGIATDSAGDVYATDTNRIVKINTAGVLSVIAGNGTAGPVIPGPALHSPVVADEGLARDHAGNLYFSAQNGYVDKISAAGVLSVVAGNGDYQDPPIPGPAKNSPLEASSLAVDSLGNLYVADARGYVEKVTPQGVLTIVAGNGHNFPATPTPGPAIDSSVYPSGIAVDTSDNVYFNDGNGYMEKVDPFGTLSVIAGTGLDANVRSAPSEGPATSTPIFGEGGVAVDPTGVVYMCDFMYVVRLQAPALTPVTPIITGTPRVGDTLASHPGTWGPGTVVLRYQWLADGVPINGATNPTYTATANVLGRAISLKVSGYRDGYSSTPAISTPTAKVAPGVIAARSRPYLSGTPRVGYVLTLHPGIWSPAGVTLRYRWLRDGRAFTGLITSTHYRLTRTDLGHRISVKVIVTKWGYSSRSAYTPATVRVT